MVFYIAFAIYIILGTIIAIVSRRMGIKSARDYYVAGSRVRGLLAAGTYAATTYSAFMMIGLVGLAYETGVGALGFELIYLLATVVLLSTAGYAIWRLSKERGWLSPSQMLGDLYSFRALSLAAAAVYLVVMLPYTAAQVQGLAIVLKMGGISYEVGVLAGALLVILWIVIGGMWSVITTDLYQALLMLAGALTYIGIALSLASNSGSDIFPSLGDAGYLGLTGFWKLHVFLAYSLPWVFFAITNPQVVARLFVQRDEGSYKRSVAYFAAYGFIYTLIAVMIGLIARGLALGGIIPGDLKRDAVTPYILSMFPVGAATVVLLSIAAAATSTANSIILAVSSSVYKDLLGERGSYGKVGATINAALTGLAGLIAYMRIGYIVDLSVLSSVLLLPIAPITLLGLVVRGRAGRALKYSALISLIVGVAMGLAHFLIYGAAKTFFAVYYGLPLSAWVLIISTAVLLLGLSIDRSKA